LELERRQEEAKSAAERAKELCAKKEEDTFQLLLTLLPEALHGCQVLGLKAHQLVVGHNSGKGKAKAANIEQLEKAANAVELRATAENLIQQLYKDSSAAAKEKRAARLRKAAEKAAEDAAQPPKGGKSKKGKKEPKPDDEKEGTACNICYNDFDDEECKKVVVTNCGHSSACSSCFFNFVRIRIRDNDILPYVPCPAEACGMPLTANDLLLSGVSTAALIGLATVHIHKSLIRHSSWVSCVTPTCLGGFALGNEKEKRREACSICKKVQVVERRKQELDEEFQKMVKAGTVRPCPKCKDMTMKEKGLCNIIQCSKCNVWWNWRTRETGNSSEDLKQRARGNGSLWEPGELQYQMELERKDPKAFRDFLERNGIPYDPNYRRGT
jgi:hypothetical protein